MMNETAIRRQEQSPGRKTVLEEMSQFPSAQSQPQDDETDAGCISFEDLSISWLQDRKGAVKKSTYSTYSYCVNVHILPIMGKLHLSEVNGDAVLDFIRKIQDKELADTTTHSILVVFKFVIKHGIRFGLIGGEVLPFCHASYHRTESRVLAVQDSVRMKDI